MVPVLYFRKALIFLRKQPKNLRHFVTFVGVFIWVGLGKGKVLGHLTLEGLGFIRTVLCSDTVYV